MPDMERMMKPADELMQEIEALWVRPMTFSPPAWPPKWSSVCGICPMR